MRTSLLLCLLGLGAALFIRFGDSDPLHVAPPAAAPFTASASTAGSDSVSAALASDAPSKRESAEPRPDAANAANATHVPEGEDRHIVGTIRRYAALAGVEHPDLGRMNTSQWSEIKRLVQQGSATIAELAQRRGQELLRLTKERSERGSLEVFYSEAESGRSMRDLSRDELLAIKERERPNRPGQLVAHHTSGGVHYISRHNPGENAAVDSLTAEIAIHAGLVIDGTRRILDQTR